MGLVPMSPKTRPRDFIIACKSLTIRRWRSDLDPEVLFSVTDASSTDIDSTPPDCIAVAGRIRFCHCCRE